jgi:hypothetical protein
MNRPPLRDTAAAGADPIDDRAGATPRTPAREAGLDTDSRGGPGSARAAGRKDTEPGPESGLNDRGGTQPRDETRIGRHGSQGLAGAQGSGGGAERGIQQAPPRAARDPSSGSGSRDRDNAGAGADTAGES